MPEQVGIIIKATDEASAVIKKIGTDADAAFNKVKTSVSGASQTIKALPEKVSRAAGAMSLLGGSAGQMGQAVGGAAARLSGIGAMLVGGPVGIGLAVVAGAVAAGAKIWSIYALEGENAANALKKVQGVLDGMAKNAAEGRERITELEKQIRTFGKTSTTATADELKTNLERRMAAQETARAEVAAIQSRINAGEQLSEEDLKHFDARKQGLEISQQELVTGYKELALLQQLGAKEAEATIATNKKIETEKRAVGAQQEKLKQLQKEEEQKKRLIEIEKERVKAEADYMAFMAEQRAAKGEEDTKAAEERAQKDDAYFKQQNAQLESQKQRYAQTAATIGETWGTAIAGMVSGTESGEEMMRKATIDSARMAIQTAAASASAKAIEAHSGIPMVGIVIGIAMAAAMATAILAYLSRVPSAAKGGRISGGIPGVDSVPVMTMGLERVLSAEQNKNFERLVDSIGRRGEVNTAGQIVINNKWSSTFTPTSAEVKRNLRDVGKSMARMRRYGFAV